MLESLGSILEFQSGAKIPNNVNLLIITDQTVNLKAIAAVLEAANLDFSYDSIDIERRSNKSLRSEYSAILYDYDSLADLQDIERSLKKLRWWCHLYPDTPLILITDPLGDEVAVKLIQSGVSGYVLKSKLQCLPQILKQSLFDFASNRAIVRQQQVKIRQLQEEIQTHQDRDRTLQDTIEQQREKIKHLEALQQKWQEREREKEERIAYLVHELRNPISAIIGFARGLREQYFGKLNPKQMQYASLLVSSGEYLLDLVEKYLSITKIDANQQTLELERIAVEEICLSSILMLEAKAKQKGLALNFEQQERIDFCTADSSCLKQILINLLSNAIKFTDRGSITLRVTYRENYLYFSVIDTGTGISAENLNKLFKPFPQISNHHENTGLGLTLSRKQARLHGGDITVTSELGKGSCFTLSIPHHPNLLSV